MSISSKTSIEWFAYIVSEMGYVSTEILNQALEKHRQEIIKSYMHVENETQHEWLYDDLGKVLANEYYNKIFKP